MNKLKFAKGNAKLKKNTAIFSLPAGHTCTGAKDCLARAHKVTGKITDGKDFALLIHGTQPPGSSAGKAVRANREQGEGGYKADYFQHYAK